METIGYIFAGIVAVILAPFAAFLIIAAVFLVLAAIVLGIMLLITRFL